jgi:uncharacterized membrane protein YbhN (UPF0104 family)
MYKRYIRPVVAGLIVVLTIAVFAYYIIHNPEIIRQLKHMPAGTFFVVLSLYLVFMLCLAWIQRATLELCNIRLGRKESTLLVMYSSIINFFGPLQSGPAFRAAYLKRKHNVKLKQYGVATLLYYGFYALFSGLFIATYFIGIWALLLIILAVACTPFALRNPVLLTLVPARFRSLKLEYVGQLAVATLAQVCTLAAIFYVELHSISEKVALVPSLIYTGAANFALFVSITPGAIGFREAFLTLTRHFHGISTDLIVAANLLDRSVYLIFMALLALVVFGLHTGNYLKNK